MKTEKKARTHADKQKTLVRIMCIVMCALMVLGVLAAVIPYLALNVSAADVQETETVQIEEESEPDHGLLLRIGLIFGSDVPASYTVSAQNGFTLGYVSTADNSFTPCFPVSARKITVCQDANLVKTDDGFVPGAQNVTLGGYHLHLPAAYADMQSLRSAVNAVNTKLQNAGIYSSLIYAFPCAIDGKLYIRIGDFGSADSASKKSALVEAALSETPAVVRPDSAALTVIDPEQSLILFEQKGQNTSLGAAPAMKLQKDGTQETYPIVTPVGHSYEGVFSFARYSSGVSVTNIVPLEQYVAGVIPYEIGTDWNMEAYKAFAVVVRSYALANLGGHRSYGIDLCSGGDCQVYRGTGRQTENIRKAVAETRGIVAVYGGKVCNTMYSAVTGGCTVNVEQVWNGAAYPYLRAVSTPWEEYATHPEGEWVTEVSGQELYEYLRGVKGYKELRGAVQSIDVEEFAENSSYIYKMKITDIYGNVLSLKGTNIIRSAFGKYVNSANFVIGKNGSIPALEKNFSVITEDGKKEIPVTVSGEKRTMQMLTADGVVTVEIGSALRVKQDETTETLLPVCGYDIPEQAEKLLMNPKNKNFILIGKGWGHGCGFSQWGIMSLSELGYGWEDILNAYLTDVTLEPYTNVLP